ncbi:MAG TPA: efflux RND transporter periplasmic adaptor subunit [Vicinamibacterales bacterium]|nr:efflux RND transporter periplasmic adaptor subunit [Vicinamibacterales bacterium]
MNRQRMAAAWVALTLVSGCHAAQPDPPAHEDVSLNVTNWTERSELYMEYPPLVTGERALFAVHLTTLADFKPLASGRPTLEFTPESGGAPIVLHGGDPSRPGAFRIEGNAPAPGRYRWALLVTAPSLDDRHDLGRTIVFPDRAAADAAAPTLRAADDPAAIAYLKEQQWTNEFATAAAAERELRTALRVPATIEPLTGGQALVSAPAAGRFTADTLLSVGAPIRAGARLGRIEPRLSAGEDRALLQSAVTEAQAALEAATTEETRAQRLLAERAVPARRVEDARRNRLVSEARLQAARARLDQRDETLRAGGGAASGNAFTLRAPIAGRLSEVAATLGASYDEGAPLFRIVRTDRVELRAAVPVSDVPASLAVSALAFEVPGQLDPVELTPHHRHDSGVLDPQTRALAVQFEVDNPGGRLLVGQSGTAVLFQPRGARTVAVPRAAVLMEAGRPYVFIHVSGERFARRMVEVWARDGDWVGVSSGVMPGDRVVVRGAYEVQLASAARGLPAEGHVH